METITVVSTDEQENKFNFIKNVIPNASINLLYHFDRLPETTTIPEPPLLKLKKLLSFKPVIPVIDPNYQLHEVIPISADTQTDTTQTSTGLISQQTGGVDKNTSNTATQTSSKQTNTKQTNSKRSTNKTTNKTTSKTASKTNTKKPTSADSNQTVHNM